MSELIGGKEALIALANGKEVEVKLESNKWSNNTATYSAEEILAEETSETDDYSSMKLKFRLKPHTITINGIEVPAPFEPKEGEDYWYMTSYGKIDTDVWCSDLRDNGRYSLFGVYRTESEIQQVFAALRSIFK